MEWHIQEIKLPNRTASFLMQQQYGASMRALNSPLFMSGNPSAYTWAGRPKYRMTGCHMWGGTFSGPVGVFCEESKNSLESGKLVLLPVYASIEIPLRSTWKTPSASSMRIEPPPDPRAKLAMPVSALMASDAQLPAGLSPPSPQFRKNCPPSTGRNNPVGLAESGRNWPRWAA